MKKIDGKTSDLIGENIEKLKQLFPEIWEEGKVDFEMLKKILGEKVETERERYSFTWHGKSDAIRMALKQSTGTLRPKKAESKNWDKTNNLYIEGDNLEVLRVLQDSYRGKVKMIYIDPPYNTGKDFVYEDDFADNIKNYKEKVGDSLKANADSSGRKHTNWLNMMYPRLRLARNLLKDDGVIFISIDDNEQANLKKVCDEIFGEENFVSLFPRITKKAGKTTEGVAKNNDYILCYGRIANMVKFNSFEINDDGYKHIDEHEALRGKYKLSQTLDYGSIQYSPSLDYEIEIDGHILRPGGVSREEMEERKKRNPSSDFCWRWSSDLYKFGLKEGFIVLRKSKDGYRIYTKTYENVFINKNQDGYYLEEKERTKLVTSLDFVENKYSNDNSRKDLANIFDSNVFDYSKPISLLKILTYLATEKFDFVFDFFSGSATTAQAVMQLNAEDGGNRKFVMVQLLEVTSEDSEARKAGYKNICEIGKERIRRAGEKIVNELREKQTGQGKLIDNGEKVVDPDGLDIGFKVFELDETNFTQWDANTQDIEKSLMDQLTPIKMDRTDEDAVYEIMLKYGVDLTMPIEELGLAGKKVFSLAGNYLLICLEKQIGLETVEEMAKLSPHRAVFYDDGFADDTVKANAEQTLKKAGVEEILVI